MYASMRRSLPVIIIIITQYYLPTYLHTYVLIGKIESPLTAPRVTCASTPGVCSR